MCVRQIKTCGITCVNSPPFFFFSVLLCFSLCVCVLLRWGGFVMHFFLWKWKWCELMTKKMKAMYLLSILLRIFVHFVWCAVLLFACVLSQDTKRCFLNDALVEHSSSVASTHTQMAGRSHTHIALVSLVFVPAFVLGGQSSSSYAFVWKCGHGVFSFVRFFLVVAPLNYTHTHTLLKSPTFLTFDHLMFSFQKKRHLFAQSTWFKRPKLREHSRQTKRESPL